MLPPLTRGDYTMQRRFWAKLALGAAVCAGSCGFAPSASAVTVYNRTAAVAYANQNWNKVVSDGYFWINGSTANYYGAGQPVPVNVPGEAGGIGDDCAHYVSSVLGTPGGGLTIPSRAGTYGEPGAARLDELLVGNSAGGYGTTYKYGQLVTSVSQLTPGDVIGYDWDGSGGGSMSGIDHTVVYIGDGKVDSHATSHLGANWTLGGADDYFFIHITLPDSIVPTTPTNVSPAANMSIYNLTPRLTANSFIDGAIGSTQVAAEWKVFQGSTLVYDTGADTTNLLGLTVPAGKLTVGNTYTWKVRYKDNYGGWSSYSTPTSLTTFLAGDYNHDGVVDSADYTLWRDSVGQTGVGLAADGNGDGTVDATDYSTWTANFGRQSGAGAIANAAVPEPSTVLLLLAGILTLCLRRCEVVVPEKWFIVGMGVLFKRQIDRSSTLLDAEHGNRGTSIVARRAAV
jgi:Putative amidase domain/Dockerin type I domain